MPSERARSPFEHAESDCDVRAPIVSEASLAAAASTSESRRDPVIPTPHRGNFRPSRAAREGDADTLRAVVDPADP